MTKKLWQASLNQKKNSNLSKFENYITKKFNKKFNGDFQKILDWSIKNSPEFWSSFWNFSKIKGKKGNKKITKSKRINGITIIFKSLSFPLNKRIFKKDCRPSYGCTRLKTVMVVIYIYTNNILSIITMFKF